MKIKLHNLIFAGMGAGALAGVALWALGPDEPAFRNTLWALDLVGKTLFVGALKMLVAPLIFASIVAGITSLPSSKELGELGAKTLFYYLGTTSVAVAIGLVLVLALRPGEWEASRSISAARRTELARIEQQLRAEDEEKLRHLAEGQRSDERGRLEGSFRERLLLEIARHEQTTRLSETAVRERYEKLERNQRTPLAFVQDILSEMIQNPFAALATTSSLGIIFFAILLALACTAVGEAAAPVTAFFKGLNAVILQLTHWVMKLSPAAVFCLVSSLLARQGPEVFKSLAGYIVTVIGGIALHVAFLLALCKFAAKRPPLEFLKGIEEAWFIAFSTRSSAATLPVTMECVEEKLGVPKKISEFVLPVGATVNMDGTALYEGVAVIFLLQMFGPMPDVGIALTAAAVVLIFLTAVLASVGAAAVPDAGLITMVLVASAVGLPEYYLVFIFSVDAFLDMFRTSTNVMGDAVGTVVIQRWTQSPT